MESLCAFKLHENQFCFMSTCVTGLKVFFSRAKTSRTDLKGEWIYGMS